jgi:DNA-binding MarR family transcriptional regulator
MYAVQRKMIKGETNIMTIDLNDTKMFHQLSVGMKMMYRFAALMNVHVQHKNCSTIAPELTMTEVHTLVDLLENPGLTSSELAKMNQKTRGAVCQTITKLEKSGCVCKQPSKTNGKQIQLYLTDKGEEVAEEHKTYDVRALTGTMNRLLEECSVDEIESFYKVLGVYNEILQES